MTFGEKLVKLRKANGYTQEALAEMLDVSRQAVARWESGETTPELRLLPKICEIYKVSADYLIHEDYESDEDIPAVKGKSEEIRAVSELTKKLFLISALAFAAATLCGIVSIVISTHPAQLAFSCFFTPVFAGLSIMQFVNYFKK